MLLDLQVQQDHRGSKDPLVPLVPLVLQVHKVQPEFNILDLQVHKDLRVLPVQQVHRVTKVVLVLPVQQVHKVPRVLLEVHKVHPVLLEQLVLQVPQVL